MTATGSRSWTDTIGNAIFFHGLDSVEYLKWLNERSFKASHLVAPFLHEFAHHWCFSSRVGNALAFTELRVHALSGRDPTLRLLCARDHVAVSCLSALLRPIAEGLALFAEFDLEPSRTGFRHGTPLTAAELCFAVESGEPFSEVMWAEFRRDAAHLDRKASIYLHDFEVREGYLPGYMLVKYLYAGMLFKAPGLTPEKFITYLRCFFWEDPEFVALLTPNEMHGPTVATQIRNHFLRRIDTLRLATDLPERITDFWEAWSAKGAFHPGYGLYLEPGQDERILSAFQDAMAAADIVLGQAALLQTKNKCSVDAIRDLIFGLALLRRFTIVARTSVTIEKEEGDRWAFIVRDSSGATHRAYWPCVGALPEGEFECMAVLPFFAAYLVIVLVDAEKVVLVNWTGPFDHTANGSEIAGFVTDVDKAAGCIAALREDFRNVGYPAIDSEAMRGLLGEIEQDTLNIYVKLLTHRGRVDAETVALESSLLRRDGIRGIFDSDILCLRTVAAMSLDGFTHLDLHEFYLERQLSLAHLLFMSEEGIDDMREALLRAVRRDRTRLVLLEMSDERIRVLV